MRITIEISDTPARATSATSSSAVAVESNSVAIEALSGGAAPTGGGVLADAMGGAESAGASKSDSVEFAPAAEDAPTYAGGNAPS